MKLVIYSEERKYLLSNKNIDLGDRVYPMTNGQIINEDYYVNEVLHEDNRTGFPDDPHIIKDLDYSGDKRYEVITNKGYGPREKFFRIVATKEK